MSTPTDDTSILRAYKQLADACRWNLAIDEDETPLEKEICTQKPGHGSCCTCQVCGYDYDNCQCSRNAMIEALIAIKKAEHVEEARPS